MFAAVALLSTSVAGTARADTAVTNPPDLWTATWAASPQADSAPIFGAPATSFDSQTIREIVTTSIGGTAVRVHVSNQFGTQPLVLGHAAVAVSDGSASAASGPAQPVTFAGKTSVTVPVGADAVSDRDQRMATPTDFSNTP